jgi:superoxide dismutase, Fe-Mn family
MIWNRFSRNFVIGLVFCGSIIVSAVHPSSAQDTQPVKLQPLPYDQAALEPSISAKTMSFHYGKHYAGAVDGANKALAGSPMANLSLEEIIRQSYGKPDQKAIYNSVCSAWSHPFFWLGLKPNGGGAPAGKLAGMINDAFGGFDNFKQQFIDAGKSVFGSGWVWLVLENNKLKIVTTPNGDTPLTANQTPLFVIDVWEHSYYLDYQNRRADYLKAVIENLANWDVIASRLPMSSEY